MTDVVEFVLGSGARREVLSRLAEAPASGRALVQGSDASESAVYDALSRLADRGLARESGESEWRLTGAGRLVADAVARCGAVGEVVATDVEYWANHHTTGLPDPFRRSIDRIAGCEVIRSPETDPLRAARRSERAIREAESVAIVAPVYSDRHAEALVESDAAEVRLILTPELVERLLRDEPDGPDDVDLPMRVHSADVALTVTDRELLFSLPDEEGTFDTTSEVVAEAPGAIRWGRHLFEHYWTEATPLGEWVASELPELAEKLEPPVGPADPTEPADGGHSGASRRGADGGDVEGAATDAPVSTDDSARGNEDA